jgi:SAM-dependent methyltransferase
MTRDYQYNYSTLKPSLFDSDKRIKKADTIVCVCQDFVQSSDLSHLDLLDVGSSNGIIDNHLAEYFHHVTGIDIDEPAMIHARERGVARGLFERISKDVGLDDGTMLVSVREFKKTSPVFFCEESKAGSGFMEPSV